MANVALTADQFNQLLAAVVNQLRPAQPAAPAYAIVPGGVINQAAYDFTSPDGRKLFQSATKAFEDKFAGLNGKLQYFLDDICDRLRTFGMDNILMIDTGAQGVNDPRNITFEYGAMTRAQVIVHAQAYQARDDRDRQSASVLMNLIRNSITPEVRDELKQRDYKVTVMINAAETTREDGVLMLYELINMVATETRATVSSIVKTLTGSGLTQLMENSKSDIKDFNNQVNMLIVALRARRREIPDIVPYLFEAYQACEDTTFVAYMTRKEEQYEDRTLDAVTNTSLMNMALEKYKTLLDKGVWMKKSKEELQFIALQAKLEETTKKLVQKRKPDATGGRRNSNANTQRDGTKHDGVWAWKGIAPKQGEAHHKKFRGKEYVCCPHHGDTKWVLKIGRNGSEHSTNCRAKKDADDGNSTASTTSATDTSTSSGSKDKSPMKRSKAWAKALATLIDEDISLITEDEDLMTMQES